MSGEVTYVIAACPSVRWVSFISVSQRVSDRRARKSFSSSSPSHVRLYDIHLSALHDGAPPVQLEEEKGGNLLHCRCVFAPIASHRHTPEYTSSVSRLPYLISFSLFFSRYFIPFYLSSLSLFGFVNPLISFFRTHSATVCNQRVSSIHGATEDEAAYHFKVAYTISSHSFFFFFFMKHAQG